MLVITKHLNFNTSNVDIKHYEMWIQIEDIIDFNTSNVDIKLEMVDYMLVNHIEFQYILCCY